MYRFFDSEIEHLDEDAIRGLQGRRFLKTLESIAQNPFYRRHYQRHGVEIERVRGLDDLLSLPVIRKADVLADVHLRPPFGERLAVPPSQIRNIVESSGTSGGTAEAQFLTQDDLDSVLDAEAVGFVWAGAAPGTVVAITVPVSMTAAGCWWLLSLYKLGCNILRLGGIETNRRLQYLKEYGANQLMVSAHYLRRLSHVARAEGYATANDFQTLRSIFVGGGGWTQAMAESWATEWEAVIHEQYGSSQRCMAWTCELGVTDDGRPGVIHGLPNYCLMEVVNLESGKAAEEGEEGEIVITVFEQQGSPLIRYATGDKAIRRVGRSCRCGRCFDGLQAGSVARIDDMLRVRGMNLWPDVVDRVVLKHELVLDYRTDVWLDNGLSERLTMEVDVPPGCTESTQDRLLRALTQELREATHLRFELAARAVLGSEVSGAAAGEVKPRRWRDLRSEAQQGGGAE